MRLITVTPDFADLAQLDRLNQTAFPEEERADLADLLQLAQETDWCHLLAFYDGSSFVGFAFLSVSTNLAYISFFAIDQSLRGQGYGSQALQLLRVQYGKASLVLEVERLDEPCDNLAERQARMRFYRKNGFKPAGAYLNYQQLSFEVLYAGQSFDRQAYEAVLKRFGRFSFQIVDKPGETGK